MNPTAISTAKIQRETEISNELSCKIEEILLGSFLS